MSGFVDQILNAPTAAVLGLVALLVFVEDALFVGFVVPGETAAILGGVAASRGHTPLAAVIVVVIAAAIVGDSVGYEVGHHLGPRLLRLRILDKRSKRLDDAQDFLARRGGTAVFLGRWVAFFRAVMPALAGAARMSYLKFLTFNAAGGIVWGTVVVLVGTSPVSPMPRSKLPSDVAPHWRSWALHWSHCWCGRSAGTEPRPQTRRPPQTDCTPRSSASVGRARAGSSIRRTFYETQNAGTSSAE